MIVFKFSPHIFAARPSSSTKYGVYNLSSVLSPFLVLLLVSVDLNMILRPCLDPTPKFYILSHRTFEHLYEVLNIGLKITNCTDYD